MPYIYRILLFVVSSVLMSQLLSAEVPFLKSLKPKTEFEKLQDQVLKIFKANCKKCHNPQKYKSKPKYRFGHILDLEQLTKFTNNTDSYVSPGQPEASKLFKLIVTEDEDDRMPMDKDPLPATDIDTIKNWIIGIDRERRTQAQKREFISNDRLVQLIYSDINRVLRKKKRQVTRYFTITHLHNNQSITQVDLNRFRAGLFKLVNSLSWSSIETPKPVKNSHDTIYRINLRDYQWKPAMWERIVKHHPYGLPSAKATQEERIRHLTNSRQAWIRADWFAHQASRPPLYHELAQIPKTDLELEKRLGINVQENIEAEEVARAGFKKSGISDFNRVIERHKLGWGAYWKSYDFDDNRRAVRKDIFRYPLGPGFGPFAFRHAGGEIIFNLPNGMQAYMLADAQGRRIDEAPINIVRDKSSGRPVVNGLSCMDCHKQGLRSASDQVRQVADVDPDFDEDTRASIRALYKPEQEFNQLLEKDRNTFQIALKLAKVPLDSKTEPVRELVNQFEKNVDFHAAAAEIGMSLRDFQTFLASKPSLAGIQARLELTQPRANFIEDFRRIVSLIRLAPGFFPHHVRLPTGFDIPAEVRDRYRNPIRKGSDKESGLPLEIRHKATGMHLVFIPAGEFMMGSPEGEEGRYKNETQHRVRLTKLFYIGKYEVTQAEWTKVMGKNPSHFKDEKNPIENVSWNNVQEFIKKINGTSALQKELRFALPTEAQWEYACRAGSTNRFSFGDSDSSLEGYAWFSNNSGKKTHPVGQKKPNAWGLYDIHGNVYEWLYGWYDSKGRLIRSKQMKEDPTGSAKDSFAGLRGGSWDNDANFCRAARRNFYYPDVPNPSYGFRVSVQDF